jgi:hypothetical protein
MNEASPICQDGMFLNLPPGTVPDKGGWKVLGSNGRPANGESGPGLFLFPPSGPRRPLQTHPGPETDASVVSQGFLGAELGGRMASWNTRAPCRFYWNDPPPGARWYERGTAKKSPDVISPPPKKPFSESSSVDPRSGTNLVGACWRNDGRSRAQLWEFIIGGINNNYPERVKARDKIESWR